LATIAEESELTDQFVTLLLKMLLGISEAGVPELLGCDPLVIGKVVLLVGSVVSLLGCDPLVPGNVVSLVGNVVSLVGKVVSLVGKVVSLLGSVVLLEEESVP
jgi:hypothetical protein